MKRHFSFISCLLPAAFSCFFVSCGRYEPQTIVLPEDAYLTIHFNANKQPGDNRWPLLSKEWFPLDSLSEPQDSIWFKLMSSGIMTGIDHAKGYYLSNVLHGQGRYRVLQGSLKEPAAFTRFSKRLVPDGSITSEEDVQLQVVNNYTVLLWNAHRFLCLGDAPVVTEEIRRKENTMEYIPPYSIGTDSLLIIAHALFYSSPNQSLLEDERFQELMQSPAEATAWINHTPGGEPAEEGLTGALLALPLIQGEGNKTAVHVFFPNGNIECKATEYLHPSWTEQLDPSSAPLITEEIINRIPSDMATVLIGLSLPPHAWPTWVRLKGLVPFLDTNIQENNAFIDRLADLSKGILLLAMAEVTDSIHLKKGELSSPPRKVMLGGNASDQPSNNELFPTTADQRTVPSFARELTYKDRRNGWFAAGSDSAAVSSFLSPKDNVHPYAKKGAGHHFFLYANLAALSPSRRIEENSLSRKPWKTLTVRGVFKEKGQLQLSALLE